MTSHFVSSRVALSENPDKHRIKMLCKSKIALKVIKMSDTEWRNLKEFVQQRESPKDIFYITIYVSVKRFHRHFIETSHVRSQTQVVEWAVECHSMAAYAISTIHARRKSKVRTEGKVHVFLWDPVFHFLVNL